MRHKLLFFLVLVFLLGLIPVQGYLHRYHSYQTIKVLREENTFLTQKCRPYLKETVGGNTGMDAPAVHYLEGGEKLGSYIGTHVEAAYEKGLEFAGSDPELQCFGLGGGTHITQDTGAHDNLVPNFIRNTWSNNIIAHGAIEVIFDKKLEEYLKAGKDPTVSFEEVQNFNRNSYELFYDDTKFLEMLNYMVGEDLSADVGVMRAALKGDRATETLWGKEVHLPAFYYIVSAIIIFVGLILCFSIVKIGSNTIKYLYASIYGLLAAFGVVLLISILIGKSFIWYESLVRMLTSTGVAYIFIAVITIIGIIYLVSGLKDKSKFYKTTGVIGAIVMFFLSGLLLVSHPTGTFFDVSDALFEETMARDYENVKAFWTDGELRFPDATGLTYCQKHDFSGECIDTKIGELNKAETGYKYGLTPLMIILFFVSNLLIYRSITKK